MVNEEIIEEANNIIEKTKNEQEKYHEERLLIFKLLKNRDIDEKLEILESVVKIFEKNSKIEKENKRYRRLELDILEDAIRNQKIREEDETINRIILFSIEDRNKNRYNFFTRENAQKFINENVEKFNNEEKINVIKNENIDIENLISKLLEENI